jgi:hypothetical protein
MFFEHIRRAPVVCVAQRDEILIQPWNDADVPTAPLAYTHHGDIQLLIRLIRSGRPRRPQDHPARSRPGSVLEEFTSIRLATHDLPPNMKA